MVSTNQLDNLHASLIRQKNTHGLEVSTCKYHVANEMHAIYHDTATSLLGSTITIQQNWNYSPMHWCLDFRSWDANKHSMGLCSSGFCIRWNSRDMSVGIFCNNTTTKLYPNKNDWQLPHSPIDRSWTHLFYFSLNIALLQQLLDTFRELRTLKQFVFLASWSTHFLCEGV